MKNYVVFLWQLLTFFPFKFFLKVFYRVKITYSIELDPKKNYVIASNHPNRVDPFLVCYLIPFKDTLRFLPHRFITHEKYMKNVFLRAILLLFGCITTKETNGGSVLKRSITHLEKGETVYIFPSGTLERKKKKYNARIGVAYLGKKAKNTEIIPVHINYSKRNHKGVEIVFKKPVRVNKKARALQKEADKIYRMCLEE